MQNMSFFHGVILVQPSRYSIVMLAYDCNKFARTPLGGSFVILIPFYNHSCVMFRCCNCKFPQEYVQQQNINQKNSPCKWLPQIGTKELTSFILLPQPWFFSPFFLFFQNFWSFFFPEK